MLTSNARLLRFGLVLAGYCLVWQVLLGQAANRRYTFAQSYFGVNALAIPDPPLGRVLEADGTSRGYERHAFITPAINIGGTHFWGHADFYVSITTRPVKLSSDAVSNAYHFGALTGLRVYPWKLRPGGVRPFLGYQFSPVRLRQDDAAGESYVRTRVKSMTSLGLGYRSRSWYAYLSYDRLLDPATEIYLSRTMRQSDEFPRQFLTLGLNWTVETTAGSYPPVVQRLDSLLTRRNTMGWFFGVGPSAAFATRSSPAISEQRPYLDDLAMADLFPDISLGYHFTRQDLVVAAAFRPIRQRREAYGFTQRVIRNSFTLEAYKFLFDYHGFAPFLGVGIGNDFVRLTERDRDEPMVEERWHRTAPSIVFGWDIRPGRRADPFLLRTNMRYTPGLEIESEGQALSLRHLEFNFIQFVLYPRRRQAYRTGRN